MQKIFNFFRILIKYNWIISLLIILFIYFHLNSKNDLLQDEVNQLKSELNNNSENNYDDDIYNDDKYSSLEYQISDLEDEIAFLRSDNSFLESRVSMLEMKLNRLD